MDEPPNRSDPNGDPDGEWAAPAAATPGPATSGAPSPEPTPLEPPPERDPYGASGWRGWVRGHAVDLTPLRISRDFRLLFAGQAVSDFGTQVAFVAVPFQVYELTGSTLAVGLLGLAELVPLLALSVLGGVVADAKDRRTVVLVAQASMTLLSLWLAWNASADDPLLWPIYLVSALSAGLWALTKPALRSWPARLFDTSLLPSAYALEASYGNLDMVIGLAMGGVLIDRIGLAGVYLVDVATFAVALGTIWAMRPSPPAEDSPRFGLGAVREGIRFLRGKPVIWSTYLVDMNAMVFGMPEALFPALARRLGGGAQLTGFLFAAPAVGSLIATLLSGRARHVRRQGVAILLSVAVWGLAMVVVGFATTPWMALLFLAVAGAGDMVSGIYRATVAQAVTSDAMRGRVEGVGMAVWTVGPSLGNLEAGAVAALVSVPFSIVSGGVLTVAGVGVLAWLVPALRRYDAGHPSGS